MPSLLTLRSCAVILTPDHALGTAHGFAAAPALRAVDNVPVFILEQKEPFLRIAIARPGDDADSQGSPGGSQSHRRSFAFVIVRSGLPEVITLGGNLMRWARFRRRFGEISSVRLPPSSRYVRL